MYYETGGDVSECVVGSVMKGDQVSQGDVWRKRSRRIEVDVALSDESGGQGLERGVAVCVGLE